MRAHRVAVSLGILLIQTAALAQSSLDTCGGTADRVCGPAETSGLLAICPLGDRYFSRYVGRVGWLLRSAGPIVVELETVATGPIRFPLIVEVVPLLEGPPFLPCTAPGYVVMHGYGAVDPCSGAVERSPVIDITGIVPVGARYALRIYFLIQPGRAHETPALRCVRVSPQAVSSIAKQSWGHVKFLFR